MKNFENIKAKSVEFLQSALKNTGAKNLLLGVSGGLDSAVVATLCAQAAPQNTHALLMPTRISNKKNLDDGINLCKHLQIQHKVIDIEPIIEAYQGQIAQNLSNIRKGNLCARVRMSLLYDHSANIDAIVVGTSNKSELMLGYGTIFGDLACAINPIGELFKSEIFEFARFLGVDEAIINKAPSADLWEGQSDENDLGYSYDVLDEALKEIEKCNDDLVALRQNFANKALLDSVLSRYFKNRFKAHMPLIANFNDKRL